MFMKQLDEKINIIIGCILWLISCVSLLLINYQLLLGIIMILLLGIVGGFSLFLMKNNRKKQIWFMMLCVFAILCEISWLFGKWYPGFVIAAFLSVIVSLWIVIPVIVKLYVNGKRTLIWIITKCIVSVCVLILSLSTICLLISAITPNLIIGIIQAQYGATNSYEPHAETQTSTFEDGTVFINDVCYGTEYPNSYLDIYKVDDVDTQKRPTILFVHGGGFTWGDKYAGGPNSTPDGFTDYVEVCIKEGYNFISLNYALAPEYRYPTPIYQLNQAVSFLQEHAEQYGIDMSNVVLAGKSAGGHIVGQFTNIQTNPNYAAEIEIEPVMEGEDIKAVLFMSALLDNERLSKTGYIWIDYLFDLCGRAYFRAGSLDGNEMAVESNVIENTTSAFPPSFISDGNYMTFDSQAKDLQIRFERLGVRHQFIYYEYSEIPLFHAYEMDGSTTAVKTVSAQMEFLSQILQ